MELRATDLQLSKEIPMRMNFIGIVLLFASLAILGLEFAKPFLPSSIKTLTIPIDFALLIIGTVTALVYSKIKFGVFLPRKFLGSMKSSGSATTNLTPNSEAPIRLNFIGALWCGSSAVIAILLLGKPFFPLSWKPQLFPASCLVLIGAIVLTLAYFKFRFGVFVPRASKMQDRK